MTIARAFFAVLDLNGQTDEFKQFCDQRGIKFDCYPTLTAEFGYCHCVVLPEDHLLEMKLAFSELFRGHWQA